MPRKQIRKTPSYLASLTSNASYPLSSWLWTVSVAFVFGLFLIGGTKRGETHSDLARVADSRWAQMSNTLSNIVSSYDGEVGLYIKDLKTGRTFEYQPDRLFLSASLIKLPIMAATFDAIEEGRLSLDSRLRFQRRFRRDGAGNLKWARSGTRYTVLNLVYAMMTRSDNTATAMLIDHLGYDYLNDRFATFGLETTRIKRTGMSLSNRVDPAADNYTTPREMGAFLEKIYRHQLAADGLSDLMLEIMKGANSRNRLAQDLPGDWKLAHKTGLLRKNCHDVGIVFTPEGDYVICVLTSDNRTYKLAKGFISSVGRKTYSYLGSNS